MQKFRIMSRMKYLECALYFGGHTANLLLTNYLVMVEGRLLYIRCEDCSNLDINSAVVVFQLQIKK